MYEGLTAGWLTSDLYDSPGYHIHMETHKYGGAPYNGRFGERIGIANKTYERLSDAVRDAEELMERHPMGLEFTVYNAKTGELAWRSSARIAEEGDVESVEMEEQDPPRASSEE